MKIITIDHTNESWQQRYLKHGRENGAATYSREIVKHQLPIWDKVAPDSTVVSTVKLLDHTSDIPDSATVVVQYLHRYPYGDYEKDVRKVAKAAAGRRTIFVVAYKQFADILRHKGYEAIYIPMTVDAKEIRLLASEGKTRGSSKFIYFGNLLHGKQHVYPSIKRDLEQKGFTVDTIADNRFNGGQVLSQKEAWATIAEYKYGIGVGRCALEMYALGLRVLIIGGQFGGIVKDRADFEAQLHTNFNGRVITYDRELNACLYGLHGSATYTSDIHETLPEIENTIAGLFI